MNGDYRSIWILGIAVLAVTLAVTTVPAAAQQGQGSAAVDEVLWPGNSQFDRQQWASLSERVLSEQPTVVGGNAGESLHVQRQNETASTITVEGPDGRTSIDVRHESASDEGLSPYAVGVRPADLHPTAQVVPTEPDEERTPSLRIFGPPGTFSVGDGQEKDFPAKAAALAESLDLPDRAAESDGEFSTDWKTVGGAGYEYGEGRTRTTRYLEPVCTDGPEDRCYEFILDCENCTIVQGRVHPTLGEQLTSSEDLYVGSPTGWITAIFSDDEPVYIGASTVVRVDASSFTSPEDAQQVVLDHISEKGYEIDESNPAGRTDMDGARLNLSWEPNRIAIDSALYEWDTIVVPAEEGNDTAYNLDIIQDASTGEIVRTEIEANAVEVGGSPPEDDEGRPSSQTTPALSAALACLGVAFSAVIARKKADKG